MKLNAYLNIFLGLKRDLLKVYISIQWKVCDWPILYVIYVQNARIPSLEAYPSQLGHIESIEPVFATYIMSCNRGGLFTPNSYS